MTKQEEIREYFESSLCAGLSQEYCSGCNYTKGEGDYCKSVKEQVTDTLKELSTLGCVLKVDRELPKTADWAKCPCDDCTAEHKLIDEWGYFCDLTCGKCSYWIARCKGHQEVIEAGYVAVEPLIEESTD